MELVSFRITQALLKDIRMRMGMSLTQSDTSPLTKNLMKISLIKRYMY